MFILIVSVVTLGIVASAGPTAAVANRQAAAAALAPRIGAGDSIKVTNAHPHPMTVALVSDSGEVTLGVVGANATARLAITIPPGAKELRFRAFDPTMEGMEVTGALKLEEAKPLEWTIGMN